MEKHILNDAFTSLPESAQLYFFDADDAGQEG